MKFFVLSFALLPAYAFGLPSAVTDTDKPALQATNPNALSTPATTELQLSEPEYNELVARQLNLGNLTGLLGSLAGSLQGIEQLISPGSLGNIESVVSHLALLLDDQTTNVTKSLLNTAGGLLNSDLVGQLEGLLTPDTIKGIGSLLVNANNLLTPQFVSQTTGLIADVAPLVNAVTQVLSVLISSVLGTHCLVEAQYAIGT